MARGKKSLVAQVKKYAPTTRRGLLRDLRENEEELATLRPPKPRYLRELGVKDSGVSAAHRGATRWGWPRISPLGKEARAWTFRQA